jgi:response regulator RpfG family c-di-GMP phosphodiesterase
MGVQIRNCWGSLRHNLLHKKRNRATIRNPTSMARILIIDDDKSFREALSESVRDFGHDVVEASGAQEAFKLIGNVDAAFLDLRMPGISGIEFLREAKPTVPVIVLTALPIAPILSRPSDWEHLIISQNPSGVPISNGFLPKL